MARERTDVLKTDYGKGIIMSKVFNLKSKTFWGVSIGVLGIILDATAFYSGLPQVVAQIAEALGFIIATMGLRDSMLESKGSLISKLVDLQSKTFWGAFIAGLLWVIDNAEALPIPEKYGIVVKIFAALFTAMGLRDAAKRSKR